jgi:hypothetical protein
VAVKIETIRKGRKTIARLRRGPDGVVWIEADSDHSPAEAVGNLIYALNDRDDAPEATDLIDVSIVEVKPGGRHAGVARVL